MNFKDFYYNNFLQQLNENLRGDLFKPVASRTNRQNINTNVDQINNMQELAERIKAFFKSGVVMDLNKAIKRGNVKSDNPNYKDYDVSQNRKSALEENWSTMLFRGHKNINPFSKTGDSKAEGDKIYWAKSPETALIYSQNQSSWGTSGQQYVNIIQKAFNPENIRHAGQTNLKIGYFSIAKPKNPNTLIWYNNFGVEDKKQGFNKQDWESRRDYVNTKFPIKNLNNDEINYSDQFNKFDPQYAEFIKKGYSPYRRYEGAKVSSHPETVLSPNEVTNVRTFIVYDNANSNFFLIPIQKIKQYDPVLYSVLEKDSLTVA